MTAPNSPNSQVTHRVDRDLETFLQQGPYVGYCYSYPHKTAYRNLPARSLEDVWRDEPQDSLFLYVHVPFCEFRCGFCNLFTLSQPDADLPRDWLAAFQREATVLREQLPDASFGQIAIGGGTPTYLNGSELESLFTTLNEVLRVSGQRLPVSMEVSPATVDAAKLKQMKDFGVDRVSMGVQSFDGKDVGAMGRPQDLATVMGSIEQIKKLDFPIMNLDLIYGASGQTADSWLDSVERTIDCDPEEVYLYPLYVRELTGLSRRRKASPVQDRHRLDLYHAGRDRLLQRGYQQVSMRMFRKPLPSSSHKSDYRCQEDAMVGLGCGSRSYTGKLHYGSRYGVRQRAISAIVQHYVGQSEDELANVEFGIELDENEIRRRHLILSLFLTEGMCEQEYQQRFGQSVLDDFPQLSQLLELGFAVRTDDRLTLTQKGIAWSDSIGPWLYGAEVRQRMEGYSWDSA